MADVVALQVAAKQQATEKCVLGVRPRRKKVLKPVSAYTER